MGWSYNFWVGNFYPKGTKSTEYLAEYSKHFNTVEINNTFYKVPSEHTLEKWREQTPHDFVFSSKFPQTITHRKMLKNCDRDVKFFIERMSVLENKLGPLLLQLPPTFGEEQIAVLRDFLPVLPKDHQYAVEVRNNQLLNSELFAVLRRSNVALTVGSSPFVQELNELTSRFVYVRWEGDRQKVKGTTGGKELDRADETKRWAQKIRNFLEETDEVFGYYSKYYSGDPTTDARQLIEFLK